MLGNEYIYISFTSRWLIPTKEENQLEGENTWQVIREGKEVNEQTIMEQRKGEGNVANIVSIFVFLSLKTAFSPLCTTFIDA